MTTYNKLVYSIHERINVGGHKKENIFIMLRGKYSEWKSNFFIIFHYLEDVFFYIYKFLKLNREDAYGEFVLLIVQIYLHIVDILTCSIVIVFWRKG